MSNVSIAIPFRFTSAGTVATATDERQIWRDRVLIVLLTKFSERVMRPNFGSDLNQSLFENEGTAIEIATRAINIAFNTWLGALNLVELIPKFDGNTGFLEINVSYLLPSGEEDQVIIKTAIFSRSGELVQEITNG